MTQIYEISSNKVLFITDGKLFIQGLQNSFDLSVGNNIMHLLPLLERSKCEFYEIVGEKIDDIKDVNLIIDKLIKYPFDHRMEYWSELALAWVDEECMNFLDWTKNIELDWMSQKLKTTFRKTFKIKSYLDSPAGTR